MQFCSENANMTKSYLTNRTGRKEKKKNMQNVRSMSFLSKEKQT